MLAWQKMVRKVEVSYLGGTHKLSPGASPTSSLSQTASSLFMAMVLKSWPSSVARPMLYSLSIHHIPPGGKSAGSRLYTHSVIDHEKLFSVCEDLKGDFLMTYDNAESVRVLAEQHGFETKAVAMKNTHHAEMNELLIGRDLSWVESGGILREGNAPTSKVSAKPSRYSLSKRKKSGRNLRRQ